jgi:hypothetical protein
MKILESQSAVLSNYEVLEHLNDQRKRYKQARRRGGGNLENVVKEVGSHLLSVHSPRLPYTKDSYVTANHTSRILDLLHGFVSSHM